MEALASFVHARSSPFGRELLARLEAFRPDGGIALHASACRGYIDAARRPAGPYRPALLGFRLEARLLAGVLRRARRAEFLARRIAFSVSDERDQT